MAASLPTTPDFEALDASAPQSADRRTMVLALVGNLVFSWSNNESLFIYYLMLLLDTDQVCAAIVFGTLNTTRARLDLVQRLAKAKLRDRATRKGLDDLVTRFNRSTRIRNEFNHCMYQLNQAGEITHTLSTRIEETRDGLRFGNTRPMDQARFDELMAAITELRVLNRDLWAFLPHLRDQLASGRPASQPQAAADRPAPDHHAKA